MKKKCLLVYVVLAVICFCSDITAQSLNEMKPVPQEWIIDGRLHIEKYDCSISALNPDYEWYFISPDKDRVMFLCFNEEMESIVSLILGPLPRSNDGPQEEFIKGFIHGLEQGLIKKGLRFNNVKYERSDIPIAGRSWKMEVDFEFPDKAKVKMIGYVGQAKDVFGFILTQHFDEDESPLLLQIANSLQLGPSQKITVNDENGRSYDDLNQVLFWLYIIVGFMMMGIAALLNLILRRPCFNGPLVAILAISVLLAAKLYMTNSIFNHPKIEPFVYGTKIGGDFGVYLIPLILFFILMRRFKKKVASKKSGVEVPGEKK